MVGEIGTESWQKWLSRWLGRPSGDGNDGGGPSSRGLVLLILLGVVLMLLGQWLGEGPAVPSDAPAAENGAVAALAGPTGGVDRLEQELSELLSQMTGGTVEVLIVTATSDVMVFAEEVTERRSTSQSQPQGGASRVENTEEQATRRPVIYRGEDGRSEQALVRYTERPRIAGVLVTAAGAGDPRTRLLLLEAVSVALDVPPHRVHIVERKR